MYFTDVADAVDNFAACLAQSREFAKLKVPLFPPKCGNTIDDEKKLVDALLFTPSSVRALRVIVDAMVPEPFSPLADIPVALVLALREHAKTDPDLAVGALTVSMDAAIRSGRIADTGTVGFYRQGIQGIVDNFPRTTQPEVRQRALLLLKAMIDLLGPPSLRPTAQAAADAHKNLQALPPLPTALQTASAVAASNRVKIVGAVIGGLALAGVAVFVISRFQRTSR